MRYLGAAALTAAIVAVAASASAQAWLPYANTELGFSVETPVAAQVSNTTVATPVGDVPTLYGAIDLGERGGMVFSVGDYTALIAGRPFDVDKALEGSVQGEVANIKGVLDSETTITIDGEPGREVTAHTDTAKVRSRLVVRNSKIYMLIGVGPIATGVPPEFDRFEKSFHFTN
ncbi:MAG TPA: hypothetical protein VGL66_00140 [Caulobacteraceae bacterium]